MRKAPNFTGTSDPTKGNSGGKPSFKNPTGKNLTSMASGSDAMLGNTNQAYTRNANQGGKGGPTFKGSAGNPVRRGR